MFLRWPHRQVRVPLDTDQTPHLRDRYLDLRATGKRTMLFALLIASNMCLQGGEQIDISRFVSKTVNSIWLKVTLKPAGGALIVYSPGYEDKPVRFAGQESYGTLSIAEPILCFKAIGGPFEFNIEVIAGDDLD